MTAMTLHPSRKITGQKRFSCRVNVRKSKICRYASFQEAWKLQVGGHNLHHFEAFHDA
jgi:hypothetical protein